MFHWSALRWLRTWLTRQHHESSTIPSAWSPYAPTEPVQIMSARGFEFGRHMSDFLAILWTPIIFQSAAFSSKDICKIGHE